MEYLESSDAPDDLPEGWCWAKLAEIVSKPKADIVDGPFGSDLKASEYVKEGVPIIRLQNVDRNRFIGKNIRHISDKKAKELIRHNFKPGDVVVTKLGDPLGKACIVPEGFGPGIVVADIVRIRLNHTFCSIPYLVYAINSQAVIGQFFQHIKGTTRPRVNLGVIRSLMIPLAPLSEQKRIVAKVEELLRRVNSVRERLARVQTILKRFRQSVLSAACSGRLTAEWREKQEKITPVELTIKEILELREKESSHYNPSSRNYRRPQDVDLGDLPDLPENWKYVSAGSLFTFVTSGSRGWAKYYSPSGPIFIRIGNLDHDSISLDLRGIRCVDPPTGKEQRRTRVQLGDILISITADVGMTALVQHEIGEAYINQHIAIARPVTGLFRPYLAWYLVARDGGQAQFQKLQRGATKVGLGLDDIKSVPVAFAPLEEQYEIVRRLEALFTMADTIEKRLASASHRTEKIQQSILGKAFRGELVPTEAELARREGRSYEPASSLLTRIKGERDIPGAFASKRRRKRVSNKT
ncbi:MAG: restriction endonuclease subunit S [Deltaproteobacteria bacterium]|nr:restriction endonuclease subunit S [Deltaproteobacteria bacterium]